MAVATEGPAAEHEAGVRFGKDSDRADNACRPVCADALGKRRANGGTSMRRRVIV
jgi:hypothetical protein